MYQLGNTGPSLSAELRRAAYVNERKPGIATFRDTSRQRISRHSFNNRLNSMRNVKFEWTNGIKKNTLRIELKKTFIKWLKLRLDFYLILCVKLFDVEMYLMVFCLALFMNFYLMWFDLFIMYFILKNLPLLKSCKIVFISLYWLIDSF